MNRSVTASVLIAIGAVLTIFGVLDGAWFGLHEGNDALEVGLREIESCHRASCKSATLRSMPIDPLFSMSGNVAYFSGIIAAVLGALAAGLRLASIELGGPVSPTRMAIAMFGVTLIASLLFLGSRPDEIEQLHIGMAAPLAIAGALAGAVGSVMLMLESRAPSVTVRSELPIATAVKAPATMAPACPQCVAPLQWVAEHERWFCKRCRAYAQI